MLFLKSGLSYSQTAANYTGNTTVTGSLAADLNSNAIDMTTGFTTLAATGDNIASAVTNIGFDFYFMGTRYTQFSSNTNGFIRLGASVISTTQRDLNLASAALITPFGEDLKVNATGFNRSRVVGIAPNRCLVIEWRDVAIDKDGTTNDGRFQARLYETTNVIEFVYGGMAVSNVFNGTTPTPAGVRIGFSNGAPLAGRTATIVTPSTFQTPSVALAAGNVNNYPVAAITDLNSVADGSRRTYFYTPINQPASPGSFAATATGPSVINLSWTDVANETSYDLYYSTNPTVPLDGTGSTYLNLAANSVSTSVSGLTGNTTYYFKLFARQETLSAAATTSTTTFCILSGVKTVGPVPSDYLTLTAALADLNLKGLAGPVILELKSSYVSTGETFPVTIGMLPCLSAVNNLTIRPEAAAVALSITSANTTATIDLNGGQFVTIDGRPGGTGAAKNLTISNTALTGRALRFINEASSDTVKNCIVSGVNTSATEGIILFSTTTGLNGNDNNLIDNCDVRDGATTPRNCIASTGTAAPKDNTNNTISNCNIFNYFTALSGADHAGIYLHTASSGWTVTGNSFYQTASRVYGGTNPQAMAIWCDDPNGAGFVINNNYIGGTAPNCGGSPLTFSGGAGVFNGIQLNVSDVGSPASSIQGNTIQNISVTSTSASTVQAGIYIVNGVVNCGNISGNTIGSQAINGSIIINVATSGVFNGILAGSGSGDGTMNFANNTIGGITITNGRFAGIDAQSSAEKYTVINNTIGNPALSGSISMAGAGTLFTGIGMVTTFSGDTLSGNYIGNINISSPAAFTGITSGSLGTAVSSEFKNNRIENINLTAATALNFKGIEITAGLVNVSNDTIGSIVTPLSIQNSGTGSTFTGISIASTASGNSITGCYVGNVRSSGSGAFNGILATSAITAPVNQIQGNKVESIQLTSTGGASFAGINVTAGVFNIGGTSGNVIGHAVNALSIQNAGSGTTQGIVVSSVTTLLANNISNNLIANIRTTGSGLFNGINVGVGSTVPAEIQNNRVENISLTGTTAGVSFTGINITDGLVNIGTVTPNVIGHSTNANSIQNAGGGITRGIAVTPSPVTNGNAISNNMIANITGTGATDFTGIYATVGITAASSFQNNTVQGILLSSVGTVTFAGINVTAGLVNIGGVTGNIIGHPVNPSSIQNAGTGTTRGIVLGSTATVAGNIVSNNLVANISTNGTGSGADFAGISATVGATVVSIFQNNTVRNIIESGTGASSFTGIGITSGYANISNDTITNIQQAGTGTTQAIILTSTADSNIVSNNLVTNFTASGATAFTGILASAAITGYSNYQNNKIESINLTSTGAASFTGMNLTSGLANIGGVNGNVIGHPSSPFSIQNSGTGVTQGILLASSATIAGNIVSNNLIANIKTTGISSGADFTGISASVGTAVVSVIQNNKVENIQALGSGSSAFTGIGITAGFANLSNDTVNLIMNGGSGTTQALILNSAADSNTVANNLVSNFTSSGATAFTGIQASFAITAVSGIQNNRIENINLTSVGAASFTGINVTAGLTNIGGANANIIGHAVNPLSIQNAGTGTTRGIVLASTTTLFANTIANNLIANIRTTGAGAFTGITAGVGSTVASAMQNNRVENIQLTATTAAATFTGIGITDGLINVTGNVIGHATASNSIQTAGTGATTGISFIPSPATNGNNIANNLIANVRTTGAGAFTGFLVSTGVASISNLTNNRVESINLVSAAGASFTGIDINAGYVNVTNDTIGSPTNINSIQNAGTGVTQGISLLSAADSNIVSDNYIGNITTSGATAFTGIVSSTAITAASNIQNNKMESINLTSTGAGSFTGINVTAGLVNIGNVTGNTIGHATNTLSIQNAGTGVTQGILVASTATVAANNINNNLIANIRTTGPGAFTGIRAGTGSTIASSMQNNRIESINLTSTGAASFTGISITDGIMNIGNITPNVVGHSTTANSIQNSGSGVTTGISFNPSPATNGNIISNNLVANITATGPTAFTGISGASGTGTGSDFQNNRVENIMLTSTGASSFTGINITAGLVKIGNIAPNVIGHPVNINSIQHAGSGVTNGIIVTSTANGNVISNNYIGNITTTGTGAFNGLTASGGTTAAAVVSSNIIESISMTNSLSGTFTGIDFVNGDFNNTGNRVGSFLIPNNISVAGGNGINAGILCASNDSVTISNDTIVNINIAGAGTSSQLSGIRISATTGAYTVTGNIIKNLTAASQKASDINSNSVSPSTYALTGIVTDDGTNNQNISYNTISAIRSTTTAAVNTAVAGIGITGNSTGYLLQNNKIIDLTNSSNGTPALPGIAAIRIHNGGGTVANNMISITNNANSNNIIVYGIANNGNSPWNIYFNSIFIGGTNGAGAARSSAFIRPPNSDNTTVLLRNNIFYNNRTGGTGIHSAIANVVTGTLTTGWPATASNFNNLYSSNSNQVGEWGTGANKTFAQWKTSSGGDANSKNNITSFFDVYTDLHLNSYTNFNLSNTGVAAGGIAVDFDNEAGNRTTTPDIGADEFIYLYSPSCTTTVTNIVCPGFSTGAIDLTVTGIPVSITYSWSNGATTEDISAVTAGTYTYTVSDTTGAVCSSVVIVSEPPLLTPEPVLNNGPLCTGDTLFLFSSPAGGNGGITQTWTGPASFSSIQEDPFRASAQTSYSGVYTTTLTDVQGCTASATTSVIVNPRPAPIIFPHDTVLCTGSSLVVVARDTDVFAGGWPAGTLFDFGFGPSLDSTFLVNGPGLYIVQVTLPAPEGFCSAISGNANISFRDAPVLFLETDSVKCFGTGTGSISASIMLGQAPYRFRYYDNTGNLVRDTVTNLAEDTLFNIAAGQYSVVAYDLEGTVYPPPSCRSDSIVITVSEPTLLVASEIHTEVQCFGENTSVTISATGGTPPYAGTGSFVQAAGSVTYTVTDANGCSSQVTAIVTQPSALNIVLSTSFIPCAYVSGNISSTLSGGTPSYGYAWSNGSTTASLSAVPSGTYTLTVTDANGCTATSALTLTAPGPLAVSGVTANPVCRGASTGSIALTVSGGAPAYSYLWNGGFVTQNRTGLAAGTYTVTVTDAGGCTKTKTFSITQPATNLLINTSQTNIRCFGLSSGIAGASASGGTPPYTYSWNTFPVQTTSTISGLTAGTYTCTITDGIGCAKNAIVNVTQPPDIIVFQTQSNVTFPGGNNGSASVSVTGGTPGYTYSWNTIPVKTTATVTGLTAGTYKCTIMDSKACPKKVTFIITEPIARPSGYNGRNDEWSLDVYPNPTSGIIALSFYAAERERFEISLTDFTGRMVFRKEGQADAGMNDLIYDFSDLAKGIYTVSVLTGNKSGFMKIVIQ